MGSMRAVLIYEYEGEVVTPGSIWRRVDGRKKSNKAALIQLDMRTLSSSVSTSVLRALGFC